MGRRTGTDTLARLLALRRITAWLAEPPAPHTCWRCSAERPDDLEPCPHCAADCTPF